MCFNKYYKERICIIWSDGASPSVHPRHKSTNPSSVCRIAYTFTLSTVQLGLDGKKWR